MIPKGVSFQQGCSYATWGKIYFLALQQPRPLGKDPREAGLPGVGICHAVFLVFILFLRLLILQSTSKVVRLLLFFP